MLWGFHNAIKGHRSLVESNILYRGISINNIMPSDPGDRNNGKRGFIIDLDLAVQISSAQPSDAPHRIGIIEFNAISVLRRERHTRLRKLLRLFVYLRNRSKPGVALDPVKPVGKRRDARGRRGEGKT